MDAMAMEAARSWHWMGELHEDLALPNVGCPPYDLRAVANSNARGASAAGPATSGPGERIVTARGMPPALVPGFADVLNSGSPRPGTWIYLSEARTNNGPVLPVLCMVYWDDETGTWRRFMATPDCIEPVTVPQPWAGLRRPPADARDNRYVRGRPPPRQGTLYRNGERPDHGGLRRGPGFVRSTRRSIPPHDARVVRLAVQAFASLMVDRSNASDHLPPPTPEEITMAVATVVHEDIVVRCDSSSSGEERAAVPSSSDRLTDGDVGYGPVRAANPAAARRGPAGPRPSAKRLPRWWRYTDILE